MVKNNLIAELPYLGKEYKIAFELLITEFASDPYESVIHFGLGGNAEKYEDRALALWLNKAKFLHITSSISGNRNHYYNTPVDLDKEKFIKIELAQTLTDGKARRQNNGILSKMQLKQT
jgi:hypothetical protein